MNERFVARAPAALAGLLLVSAFVLAGCLPRVSPSDSPELDSATRPLRADLADVDSWAFAIGGGALGGSPEEVADRLGVFGLVVIDGEEATAEEIAALRAQDTVVLAYLSVGTIEPWRSSYAQLRTFALEPWDDWDEYYADVNERGYRNEMLAIADAMMEKGFDGLFVDNVDMIESHPSQAGGMRTLISLLSGHLRRQGRLLFAQNGDDFALTLASLLDGWNREGVTFDYDFDATSYVRVPRAEHELALAALKSMRQEGVFVTTTDYVSASGSADEREALRVARDAGALPYVSDIDLERVPQTPF